MTALLNTSHFIGFFILNFDIQVIPPEFLKFLLCPSIAFIETSRAFDKTHVPVPALSPATAALQVNLHEVVQVAFSCFLASQVLILACSEGSWVLHCFSLPGTELLLETGGF